MATAEVVYLTTIGVLTAAALVVAAGGLPGARARWRSLLGLVTLWGLLVALVQPATRLTADLAFVFGSQLTIVAAGALRLASVRKGGRRAPRARARASSPGGGDA